MPRMRILTANEQELFDRPPSFNHCDRKRFFDLPKGLLDVADSLRTPSGQIGFLLMCGYFKATERFFQPYDFHERDVDAVARALALQSVCFSADAYAKQTRARHQQLILDFHGSTVFDVKAKDMLAVEIGTMARVHLKSKLILERCVDFLIPRRVQIPQYGTLLEMIRIGLQDRKTELFAFMDRHLSNDARGLLVNLFTAPDDQNRYRLTLLKNCLSPQDPRRSKRLWQTLKYCKFYMTNWAVFSQNSTWVRRAFGSSRAAFYGQRFSKCSGGIGMTAISTPPLLSRTSFTAVRTT